ncbi:glycoside hydrolase family 3 protein [Lentibacillus salicampi]|uniref:beta-N-acetylhexosaminidase n=1 Tax=Lentibacillus salicampi TaxID=175306 RepID=A0A4Y9AB91_9BACI|nr:glycoside hydrolase family 3 protein [Lentibacillus salicampi]TFJ92467.1 glycoside hydrolase family 3 protein [Lentibacillus salicampi]
MKNRHLLSTLSLLLVLALIFPAYTFADSHDSKQDFIHEKMENMTLEEKVGQLFVVHVYGKTPTDPDYEQTNLNNNRGGKNFKEVIENYHPGGVIYFNWTDNIGTPIDMAQVNALSDGLQEIAMEQQSEIPLFVSTDQEGGIVQRVTSPGTVFPGNMALGATRSEEYAAASAGILGEELSSLGINMNYAPVADVNINPANPVIGVRSFGENPDLVSRLTVAQVNAYKQQNVLATAKHFPGHGDTAVDSHYGLPIINHDLETLHEVDLKPFKAAIEAGIDSIMTAHIVVPALDDSGLPATLSKPILTDLLREEMGFDGLIITDSLGMSGANVVPEDRVAVEAFKAGNDVLLNPPDVELAHNSMMEAVENGEITEERIDESVYRILEAKMDKGLFDDPYTDPDAIDNIGTDDHLQTADEIADRSITLVKNENDVLPLNGNDDVFITGPSAAKPDLLSDQLTEKGIEANSFATGTSPTDGEIEEAVANAEDAEKVVVTTYTANTNAAQEELVHALEAAGKPVVVAAIRNPYDLMVFPEVDAYLATYGFQDVSVKALANVISGDVNPSGKLPVTIPDMYDEGHGLDYVDTPLSADGMQTLVESLAEAGEIEGERTARSITMHLTSVNHFEKNDSAEKVIKHMNRFKQLLDHHKAGGAISAKAHSYLITETDRLIEKWS